MREFPLDRDMDLADVQMTGMVIANDRSIEVCLLFGQCFSRHHRKNGPCLLGGTREDVLNFELHDFLHGDHTRITPDAGPCGSGCQSSLIWLTDCVGMEAMVLANYFS